MSIILQKKNLGNHSLYVTLSDLLVLYTEDEGMVARILVSTSQLFMELVISR